MHSLLNDYRAGLLKSSEPPCVSLYQPTHRRYPENQQDPIRFRNLTKSLEQSLRQKYTTREVTPLLELLRALADDHEFGITRSMAWRCCAHPGCSVFTGSSAQSPNLWWWLIASISSR